VVGYRSAVFGVLSAADRGGWSVTFVGLVEVVGKGIDAAGVGVIVLGGLAATAVAGTRLVGRDTTPTGAIASSSAGRSC
jgi:hypothetical protein